MSTSIVENRADYAREMAENGYIIVRNAFDRDQIQQIREKLIRFFQTPQYAYLFGGRARPDAFSTPALGDILGLLSNERIADVIKQLAGEDAVFCHHSDAHCNLMSGWHKDNSGYGTLDEWSTLPDGQTYGVYKVALYLEDHIGNDANDSSLKVRKGSHTRKSMDEGEALALYTQSGDAIIFDCRVTHMGLQDILLQSKMARQIEKVVRRLPDPALQYTVRELYRKMRGVDDRYALFYVFGRRNKFTDNHIEGNKARQRQQNAGAESRVLPELAANLEKVGIGY